MPIGVYYEAKSMSAEQYGKIMEGLNEANLIQPDNGCIHHTCFGEPGHLCVFDVWETEGQWREFYKTLEQLIRGVGVECKTTVMPVHSLASIERSVMVAEPAGV